MLRTTNFLQTIRTRSSRRSIPRMRSSVLLSPVTLFPSCSAAPRLTGQQLWSWPERTLFASTTRSQAVGTVGMEIGTDTPSTFGRSVIVGMEIGTDTPSTFGRSVIVGKEIGTDTPSTFGRSVIVGMEIGTDTPSADVRPKFSQSGWTWHGQECCGQAVRKSSSSDSDFKAAIVFKEIAKWLDEDGSNIVKKMKGVFTFKVKGAGGKEGVMSRMAMDVSSLGRMIRQTPPLPWVTAIAEPDDRKAQPTNRILPGKAEDWGQHGSGHKTEGTAATRRFETLRCHHLDQYSHL